MMSPLGKRIWLHMQEHEPPYNRSTLARKLARDGTLTVAPTSIGNYLYHRCRVRPEFVNAVVDTLGLNAEQEAELHWLYFRGNDAKGDPR